MKTNWNKLFCLAVQLVVRAIARLTGRGGGKFARLLPPGQTFLLQNYSKNLAFQVDTTYPIEGMIWLSGVYDIQTTRFFQQVIQAGDVVLDVGANCGALTLVAAQLVGNGTVYAFEPGEAVRDRLQANLRLNPEMQARVNVVPLGLGAAQQQLSYYEDPSYRGNGALFQSEGDPVTILTLDEWVASESIRHIDFIKLDVEGMEYDVLMGGKETLDRFHPILYVETLPIFFTEKPYTIPSVYEFLSSLGYQIRYPTPPYATVPLAGPYPANSVAIHPRDLGRLQGSRTNSEL